MKTQTKLSILLGIVFVGSLASVVYFRGEQLMALATGEPAPSAEVESVISSLAVTHGEHAQAVELLEAKGLNVAEITIAASGKDGILIAYKQPDPLYVVLSSGLVLKQKPVLSDPAEAAEFDRALKIAAIEWEAAHPELAARASEAPSGSNEGLERLQAETAELEAALGPALTATAPATDPVSMGLVSEEELESYLREQIALSQQGEAAAPEQESAFIDYGGTPIRKIGFADDGTPLPEEGVRAQAAALFEKLRPSFQEWTVTYPADGDQKHEILVFTDWTCPYCRRLHSRIDQLNAQGVTVHYMLFPRKLMAGREAAAPVLDGFRRAWCAEDQRMAFDDLFAGIDLAEPGEACAFEGRSDFPAEEHFVMGLIYGIKGTPLTVSSTGARSTGFSGIDKLMADLGIAPGD